MFFIKFLSIYFKKIKKKKKKKNTGPSFVESYVYFYQYIQLRIFL